MNGVLYYDTKYGSTTQISEWIADKVDNVEIRWITENPVIEQKYDYFILGTPIFIGKPTINFINFINKNKKIILYKPLFLFITSWAQSTKYKDECKNFIALIKSYLSPCVPAIARSLPGRLYMDEITQKDRNIMGKLLRRIDNLSEEFDSKTIEFNDKTSKEQSQRFGCDINEWFGSNMF